MSKRTWMTYPETDLVSTRSGIKVGWRTYSNLETAKECSVAAENNAWIQWEAGYDFGYQSPGYIHAHSDGTFEVVIP